MSPEASFDCFITQVGLPRICLVCRKPHQFALAPQMPSTCYIIVSYVHPLESAIKFLGLAVNKAISITLRTGLAPVAMESESLATAGRQVGRKFAKLEADTHHVYYSGSIREILIDQRQRFRLWADNMGLCSYGHHSLDYRCRDATKVYEYVYQLLTDLEGTLDLSKSCCIVHQL